MKSGIERGKFSVSEMLNVKRRCKFNLNKNHELFANNNNNIVKGFNEQKFCLQHNNCNCTTAEVCIRGTLNVLKCK